MSETIRFIDLFAGIGGIRLPFDELGYKCVFSSEWDAKACETYKANFNVEKTIENLKSQLVSNKNGDSSFSENDSYSEKVRP